MIGKTTAAPIRIGVLGAARIADLAIVRPARVTGHRRVAVAARDRRRAEDFAHRHGVERALGTYADVLADTDVEAIYNPLANALHGPWNLAAIQAGKHVLSEKPFAGNADEARVVRDAAAAAQVTMMGLSLPLPSRHAPAPRTAGQRRTRRAARRRDRHVHARPR